jgi:hypothetical protein
MGACPTSIPWTASAITAPTKDPLVANGATSVPWSMTVGTTTEYQASVPLTALSPGTNYCSAVFSTHSSSARSFRFARMRAGTGMDLTLEECPRAPSTASPVESSQSGHKCASLPYWDSLHC